MRKNILNVVVSLIGLLMVSCNQDIDVLTGGIPNYYGYAVPTYIVPGTVTDGNGNNAITFGNYTNGQIRTSSRAIVNSNSQTGYDDFSLYVWTKDSVVMNSYHTQWVIGNPSGWAYVGVDDQKIKFFDRFVEKYNFMGVIPMTDAIMSNGVVTTEVEGFTVNNEETTNTPKEFLYSTTVVNNTDYANGAVLNFNHGNAKIYLKFTSNDANTKLIDYAPYTPGTPGVAAWDEEVSTTTYTTTVTTIPTLGPLLTAISISDEDMAYVNSKYTATKGWVGYQTSNVITGSLDENMWDYLVSKYPALSSMNLANWDSYTSNPNMRLVQITKNGHTSVDNDSYTAVWVNVQNVNWQGTTTTTTIHHDAVPEIPASGKEGIIILPAISTNGDGSDAVLASYPIKANASISLDGVDWEVTNTATSVTYSLPTVNEGVIGTSTVASPTTWYTLPCNEDNVGYTVKFSYEYKGVNVYDTRVWLPKERVQWEKGKYYTYVINITGKGNGHIEPNDEDGDDPVVTTVQNHEIKIVDVTVSPYGEGETYTITVE